MPVTVDIRTPLPEAARLLDEAFVWLRWVDAVFSTYKPGSQISRLATGALEPAACHPAVREVLAALGPLTEATGGFFDPYATGVFDPSGYVKGWAAERLSRRLVGAGAPDHFADLGGDVRVRGHRAPGEPWRIGIRDRTGRVVKILAAVDLGVATSGLYARGPHVVDPRTGAPADCFDSVTVTGPDLGVADAYATALLAMDRGECARFAPTLPEGYGAFLMDGGTGYSTAGFSALAAAGGDTRTTEPPPGGQSGPNSPPRPATIEATMDSPSPEPPVPREREGSAR